MGNSMLYLVLVVLFQRRLIVVVESAVARKMQLRRWCVILRKGIDGIKNSRRFLNTPYSGLLNMVRLEPG